jgi:hypothetical protein
MLSANRPFWQPCVGSVIGGLQTRDVETQIGSLFPGQPFKRLGDLVIWTSRKPCGRRTKHSCFVRRLTKDNNFPSTVKPMGPLESEILRELAHCLARYETSVRHALTGCRLTDRGLALNEGLEEELKGLAAARPRN